MPRARGTMIVLRVARGALHLLGRNSERECLLSGTPVYASEASSSCMRGEQKARGSSQPDSTDKRKAMSRISSPVFGRSVPAWIVVDELVRRFKVPLSLRFVLLCRVRAAQ